MPAKPSASLLEPEGSDRDIFFLVLCILLFFRMFLYFMCISVKTILAINIFRTISDINAAGPRGAEQNGRLARRSRARRPRKPSSRSESERSLSRERLVVLFKSLLFSVVFFLS